MSKSILQIILQLFCAKKPLKKHKYSRNETILKIGLSCKGYSPCKILTLGQKLKFQKTCQNPFYKSFRAICVQKTAPKNTSIFEKWDHFENRPSCKGYSPCKILTLGQKLKFQKTCQNPFYKSFRVVLCKKPLQKTPNIREMRPFWKSGIMQRL